MSPSRPLKGVTGCLTSLGLCCLKAALVESEQADERWVRKWEELRGVAKTSLDLETMHLLRRCILDEAGGGWSYHQC